MSFDAFNDEDSSADRASSPIKPIWVDNSHKSKEKTLTWFKDTYPILERLSRPRIENMCNNLYWFTGDWGKVMEYRLAIPGKRDVVIPRRTLPFVVNHLFDLTEQKIARLSRFKPSITVLPANDEANDKISAEFADTVLKHLSRQNNFDTLLQEIERWNAVFGEMYIGIEWNDKIGDVHPEKKERIGDVEYKLKEPFYVFPEPKRKWSDVSYLIEIYDIMHVEEVKKKWKNKKLQSDNSQRVFQEIPTEVLSKMPEEVVVYRIVHPPNEFLPEGFMAWIAGDQVLDVAKEYPYSHNSFPYERITDIDVPGRLHGMSLFEQLKPIQHNYNKLTSLATRNVFLTSHPKIMMPEGAAKVESMGNAATVVTYQGPIPPSIITFPANPPEVYGYRDQLREEMQQISGIHGVSRGEPPPGIRAGIALQFLEEQEQQRANASIVKHNDLIVRVNRKAISVAGDYYKTKPVDKGGDGRMLRILGANNQYEIETLEDVNLSRPYDITIQNSTALAESRAGRIQQVIDLVQNIPGLLSPEQIADMLDLASPGKFYDVTTAALRAAESENERMLKGRPVPAPTTFEEHLAHWRAHVIPLQSRRFKQDVPREAQELFFDHIMAHEALMLKDAMEVPERGQQIRALAGFPLFYTRLSPDEKFFLETGQLPPPEPSPEEAASAGALQALAQGVPPEGEPIPQGEPLPPGEAASPAPAPADVQPPAPQPLR